MHGPIRIIKSNKIDKYQDIGPIFEWEDGDAYLIIEKVLFNKKTGVVLCYHNPPVHQIGTTGLYAFHDALDLVYEMRDELQFMTLYGANDPVHSGGDLKESLNRLKESLAVKQEKEAEGASGDEIDQLFSWGESRLEKGVLLYRKIRDISGYMRVVGICGGGLRFGGSAEIPLMTDYLISDSRSGMCFSEALIGIIPGWGGITRVLVKSGIENAAYMAKTTNPVFAADLKAMGIYNRIVDIPFDLPRKPKTGDPVADSEKYLRILEDHEGRTGVLLFPEGLKLATCPVEDIPMVSEKNRKILARPEEIALEMTRRTNPENYTRLWGKPLRDVRAEIARIGRPLAPQSIRAIDQLLRDYDPLAFDEEQFIHKELRADAALYRDPRFLEGLSAQLEQRVPDFRFPKHYP